MVMKGSFAVVLIFFCVLAFGQKKADEKDLPSNRAEFEQDYATRIKKEYLYRTYIPKDVNDALDQLDKKLDASAKQQFIGFTEDQVKIKGGLKMWIINNWGFSYGSRLSHLLKGMGITHPDDMAEFLMVTFHRSLLKEDLKIQEQIEFYKTKRNKIQEERAKKAKLVKEELVPKKKE